LLYLPSGSPEDITQLEPPRVCLLHVTPDIEPLMEGDSQRIIAVDVPAHPLHNFFAFALKGAKETVPDDENAGVVAIKIALV